MGDGAMILDDFLTDYQAARAFADRAVFEDVEAPDGVIYPYICTDLPEWLHGEVRAFCDVVIGRESNLTVFMRLSPEGVKAPHQAHSDEAMGDWSLMLYLNRPEHCQGGTALVRHIETGMMTSPDAPELVEVWRRDTNTHEAWEIMEMVDMHPNRAFVFPAKRMHRAEPVGGFGDTQDNARLVLTAFFS